MAGRALDRRLGVRRLTARSVVASTLLGASPPELPTRVLVGTAELLGIAPGTARVAMSRMVVAGELAGTADGYRLVGPELLARQARQARSRAGSTGPWDGDWRMVVVTGDARPQSERVELRSAMTALRYAELREGVWMRPANLDAEVPEATVLEGLTARPDRPVELAASLWDLAGWAGRAAVLLDEMDALLTPLQAAGEDALADGFVVSAAVLRHFQADPLLPAELLPIDWPGATLRSRYDAFDAAFRSTLLDWQRRHHPR